MESKNSLTGNTFNEYIQKLNEKSTNGDVTSCPPKSGGCPMMFRYIPNGQTVTCESCGQKVTSPNISF